MARSTLNPTVLWRLAVQTHPDAGEAIGELLLRTTGELAVITEDLEKGTTEVAVFAPTPFVASTHTQVRRGLKDIEACGLRIGLGRVTHRRVRQLDWAESWKRHFPPLQIGRSLLVQPSWVRRKPVSGQALVVLDPGLSFGTGQHATTRFCLERLVQARRQYSANSLLDMGTGSGILAIAAARLGYERVEGFDFDPAAVRVALENAATNAVKIKLHRADLTRLHVTTRRRFDVVCANLTHDLLIQERDRIIARVEPEGVLVLAGILSTQFAAVREAYAKRGYLPVKVKTVREWTSGSFQPVGAVPA